jgi:hypothetical protein
MASEGDYLRLLRRPDLPVDVLEKLLEDRHARSLHTSGGLSRRILGPPGTRR